MNIYTTGDICEALKIDYQKLLYQERRGYIPKPRRTASNMRYYTEEDLQRLKVSFRRREGLISEITELRVSEAAED